MSLFFACFGCGSTGHVKSECPNRTPRANTPPGARRDAAPEEGEIKTQPHCLTCGSIGAHHPGCGTERSDPERIRAILEAAGFERSALVRTEFRTRERIMPRTEAQLREMAAAQVAASRADVSRETGTEAQLCELAAGMTNSEGNEQ